MAQSRYSVLALDLDGTLLDPAGEVAPATAAALGRAVAAGIRPVLCTGRRPRRAFPIARALGLATPMVCNSGALIRSADDRTVWRADWDRALFDRVRGVCRAADQPLVSFSDRPVSGTDYVVGVARTGRPLFDDFLDHNRPFAEVAPGWEDEADRAHFHLCAIDTRPAMLALEATLRADLGDRIQTFVQRSPRYAGTMCEVLRADANKWTAIEQLCRLWGVDRSAVCAVGDDMNDIPMLRGAGLGVAMAHAPASVLAAADRVTASNADGGVARLIDEVLLA